jgi:tape measure domain-containing protein
MRSAGATAFTALRAGFRGLQRSARLFIGTFRSLLKVFIAAAAGFALFARSVLDTGNKINKFVNTLVILKGGTTEAIAELELLFALSNKLGTNFSAAAAPFVKFAAAAAGALTDVAIRDVFESFATVGVALQLTQSEVTGVFLALQQIASKGVVSMEELRLQLAERVPGAMRLAAQSMGMSMRAFEKAVQERTINAGDFLEKFAQKLKDVYGDAALIAADRLFADIQRLGNAFTAFKTEIFQSGFEEGLRELVRSAAGFLNSNPELSNALGQFSKGIFTRVADFLDSLSADRVIGALNAVIGAIESLINSLRSLTFFMSRAFGDDLKVAGQQILDISKEINAKVLERNELQSSLSRGGIEVTSHLIGPDTERTMSNTELFDAEQRISFLSSEIVELRGNLVESRIAARDLGLVLDDLPDTFEMLPIESFTSLRPGPIELPRIDDVSGGDRGSLITIKDTAFAEAKRTGDMQDALEVAERLSTIEMPEFYKKVATGEIRESMSDLARVTMDLNGLNESQAETLELIGARHLEVATMRNLPEELIESAKLNDLTRDLGKLTEDYLIAEEKRNELKKEQLKLMEEEEKRLANLTSFQKSLEETFTSVQDVIINSIKKVEDSLVELVVTGKTSFKDLADSIISELARMAIQAFFTRYIMGPLLEGWSNLLGNALGGSFSTQQTGPPGFVGPPAPQPSPPTFHSGGIVGASDFSPQNSNGLMSNEQNIVALKGEGVFTQDQMKALAPISQLSSIAESLSNQEVSNILSPTINVSIPKVRVINEAPDLSSISGSAPSNMSRPSEFDSLRMNKMPIEISRENRREMSFAPNIQPNIRASSESFDRRPQQPDIPSTKVEVINNTPEEATVTTTQGSDGGEITRIIIGTVSSDIARDGDLSKLLRGKFGLRTQTGLR